MNPISDLQNRRAWSSTAWDNFIEAQRNYDEAEQLRHYRNAELVFHACSLWLSRRGLLLEHESLRPNFTAPLDAVAGSEPQLEK